MPELLEKGKPYNLFSGVPIEQGAIDQMETAIKLPITVAGALMPDAHQGYGLPIGGVLATKNAIIPYAVGMDIGCRMALSIFELPDKYLLNQKENLIRTLFAYTKFGHSRQQFRNKYKKVSEFKQLKNCQYNTSPLKNSR